ncbi:uncharacterized protein NEMAJ01_0261 [Nematocida major]|uniref:uncharacterized protein n=1 Tax=Nematocida major TaxID=1912982 RepID=UPI0020078758|nr:uncharacterized protein NEMAJ01_0261 [Nematocida major]KAH9385365.1 hypothetical protein NEMAJ01_0261 [Nematocida major]
MKTDFVIVLALFMSCINARICLDDLIGIQKTEVDAGLIINPKGPLNMLRGYIYSDLGYTYNKRFLSPEIETSYSLSWGAGAPQYTRSATKDRAYSSNEFAELAILEPRTYSQKYHTALIKMFPSVDGSSLSIHVAKKDSFIRVLQDICTKEQARTVLASFLLLSEGVKVPILASKKKIVLWKDTQSENLYKEAPKYKKQDIIDELAVLNISLKVGSSSLRQTDFFNVASFFIQNEAPGNFPCTAEEFETNQFLDTPQFLIQAYLFEFLQSKEDALQFAKSVYCLLKGIGASIELASGKEDIFNRCFLASEEKSQAVEYLGPIVNLQKALKTLEWFPFPGENTLSQPMVVRHYSKGSNEFTKEVFSNCTELGLFALFCCLAYDPNKKVYNIDRSLGERKELEAVKDLRAFFNSGVADPKKNATVEMLEEWNKVMNDLTCTRITYAMPSKCGIRAGAFNALYAFAEVTGQLETEQEKLDRLMAKLASSEEPAEKVLAEFEEYVSGLLLPLSINRNVKVVFSDLKKCMRTDKVYDVFGEISLEFGHEGFDVRQGLKIRFSLGHVAINVLPISAVSSEQDFEALFKTGIYRAQNDFSSCLFLRYLNHWVCKSAKSNEMEGMIKALAKETAVNPSPSSIRKALILGHALLETERNLFAMEFFKNAKGKCIDLPESHLGLRLARNLLGNRSLENLVTSIESLKGLVQLDLLDKVRTKITVNNAIQGALHVDMQDIVSLWEYAEEGSNAVGDIVVGHLRAYKEKTGLPLSKNFIIKFKHTLDSIFNCLLCSDKTLEHIDELATAVLEVDCPEDLPEAVSLKNAHMIFWFISALERREAHPELISPLFRRIEFHDADKSSAMLISSMRFMFMGDTLDYTLRLLEECQSLFLESVEDQKKLAQLQSVIKAIYMPSCAESKE